jgi:DNA-binding Lrp family transcriptional regulator
VPCPRWLRQGPPRVHAPGRRARGGQTPVRAADRGHQLGHIMVAVDINATDRQTTEDFEAAIVAFDEVVAVRRLFGQPDYLVQVAVADARAYEAFLTGKLIGLPALSRTVSHQTMKRLKG